ncbi:hypothetical protein [Modestobacter sp. I12A-02662]|uniref:hypothetical protein n=1 Tax=Modestobacter sp. I12A-02662 TaxID=1730496 RepID=UPI0034DDFDEE
MLIDCDTCTVRGQGCDDCVVTVLLGAPPGWRGSDPSVVPLTRRAERPPHEPTVADAPGRTDAGREVHHVDTAAADAWSVVDLDDVERRAVRALADFGLVPPLRHQDASTGGERHVG